MEKLWGDCSEKLPPKNRVVCNSWFANTGGSESEAIGGVPSSPLAEGRAEEIKFSYHTIFIGELTCGGNLPAKPVLELPKHIAPMNRGGLPAKTTIVKIQP